MDDVSRRKEKGITLIALVITIIVLLILAGVTINLSIGERGIFTTAQRAVKETKIAQKNEEVELDKGQAILSEYDGTAIGKRDSSKNRALSGKTNEEGYTYKNPIIPKGFIAVDDGAGWYYVDDAQTEVKGWNDGLVIENDVGDQFVWVPCSMEESNDVVKYEERFNEFNEIDGVENGKVDSEALPVDKEESQIAKYEGFYIARYEAGNDKDEINTQNSIPRSQYGIKVWNNITYTNSVASAKLMINDESKYGTTKSGLITSAQWDTIMSWYEKSGIGIRRTNQNWGSYYGLNYNVDGYYFTLDGEEYSSWTKGFQSHTSNEGLKIFHASGLNDNGYKKNIADLAGNVWEWTANIHYVDGVTFKYAFRRGNSVWTEGAVSSIDYASNTENRYWDDTGFRVVLYIM